MFHRLWRRIWRMVPRMATAKAYAGSLSIITTVVGILIGRMSSLWSSDADLHTHQNVLLFVIWGLFGLVILISGLHILIHLKAENDRRVSLDDRMTTPDSIRFKRRTDTLEIIDANTAHLTWDLELESDADESYTYIVWPMEFEIGPADGAGTDFRQKVRLLSLTVDREDATQRTGIIYKQIYTPIGPAPNVPSMVKATIDIPVNMAKGDTRSRVVLKVAITDGFPRALTAQGDFLTVDIPFVTRELVIEARCGAEFARENAIQGSPGSPSRHIIEAKSALLNNIDARETSRAIADGLTQTTPEVRVVLNYPKTGYRYAVYFSAYQLKPLAPRTPAVSAPPAFPAPAVSAPDAVADAVAASPPADLLPSVSTAESSPQGSDGEAAPAPAPEPESGAGGKGD